MDDPSARHRWSAARHLLGREASAQNSSATFSQTSLVFDIGSGNLHGCARNQVARVRSIACSSVSHARTEHARTAKCPPREFDAVWCGCYHQIAGWSSLVARWAHNPKVGGSNPPPATNL